VRPDLIDQRLQRHPSRVRQHPDTRIALHPGEMSVALSG
jgi:hypothetical protein